jgi:hypothetical protein
LKPRWAALGPTVVVALSAAIANGQGPGSPRTKTYQPFTAKYVLTYLDEVGRTKTFSGTVYRKADGSISQIEETEGPRNVRGTSQTIAGPAEVSWKTAESYIGTFTTMYLDQRQFQNLAEVNFGTCAILTDESVKRVGESHFLGVKVIEVEEPTGRASVLRRSVAPDLGCFSLQTLDMERGVVRTITQATELILGEPDPQVFRVPDTYSEVSPLELEARWRGRFGQDYFGPEISQRLEAQYQQGKERQRQLTKQ